MAKDYFFCHFSPFGPLTLLIAKFALSGYDEPLHSRWILHDRIQLF